MPFERTSEAGTAHFSKRTDEAFCIIEVLFDEGGKKGVDYRFVGGQCPAFEWHAELANATVAPCESSCRRMMTIGFKQLINGRIALTGE